MKVKNIFLKLTAIAFLGAFSLKAEIPVTQIRGLASILNTECEFLSPVYGTLLDKSLYPKNLSNFGPRSTKTVKFARKIFHVVDNNLRNSVAPGNITTYLTPEAIGKIVAHIKNYTDNPSYDLKKSIADVLEQLSTTPNISARSIKSSKKHFNRDLVESLSENEVYIQNNTIYLLLTLLWKKVGNKTDFYEYFWGLYNTLINKNLFNEEIHQLLPDNVEKDQFIEILKSNINQNYTSDDAQNIKEEIMAYPQRLSFNKLAFFILEASLDQHKILPDLLSYGITTYKGKTFADCGSTTIRNFFNAIIWNTEEQNFNVNILRSLDANENLINFYTEYPNESTMCTREAHDAWANVVSGIRGVTYNETTAKCNIRNGIRNIFKIISHLLNSKLTSFEDFAELLEQKTGIKLKVASYSDEDWGKEDNVQQGYTGSENLVKIQITKVSSSPFEIAWRFTSGHSNIIFPTTTISERYAYLSNILSENFRSQSLYQNTKNIILLNQNVRQYFLSQIRPIEERTILEFFEIHPKSYCYRIYVDTILKD